MINYVLCIVCIRCGVKSPVDEKQTSFSAKWIANMDLYREQISPHAQLEALALQRLGQCRVRAHLFCNFYQMMTMVLVFSIDNIVWCVGYGG